MNNLRYINWKAELWHIELRRDKKVKTRKKKDKIVIKNSIKGASNE